MKKQTFKPRRPFLTAPRGFTLIEVMIVVAVIGILTAIALPSYREYVAKSRRADAQRALMDADQFMRRYYSTRNTYLNASLPSALTKSPQQGSSAYSLALSNLGATTYTITATRAGLMSGDKCGDLAITQAGTRSLSNNATGTQLAQCFKG